MTFKSTQLLTTLMRLPQFVCMIAAPASMLKVSASASSPLEKVTRYVSVITGGTKPEEYIGRSRSLRYLSYTLSTSSIFLGFCALLCLCPTVLPASVFSRHLLYFRIKTSWFSPRRFKRWYLCNLLILAIF